MRRSMRFPSLALAFLLLLLGLFAMGEPGFSEPPPHEGRNPSPLPYVPGEVLVQLEPGARIMSVLSKSPAKMSVQDETEGRRGRTVLLKLSGGESLETAIASLAKLGGVRIAQPNYVYQAALVPDDPLFNEQWALPKIGAQAAWNLSTGSADVLVAILDTGVDPGHPDLAGNLWTNPGEIPGNGIDDDGNGYVDDVHGINSTTPAGASQDILDTVGHGTHVAGIIGAIGNNGAGVAGIDWAGKIVTVKASTESTFYTSDLVEGIDYVTSLREEKGLGIVAINASFGAVMSEDPLLNQAIGEAGEAGILFVAAAGNENSDNDVAPFYPGSLFRPTVLSVAATDANDSLAAFGLGQASNYGRRTVHLAAPGKSIQSTYLNMGYSLLSGTSMAAPHVTGVLALLKAQDPARDWIALRNKVLSSGTPLPGLAAGTITGRRLLAAGNGGLGALTGSGQTVKTRLRPIGDTLELQPGDTLDLAALNISDDRGLGNLSVPLARNGSSSGTVLLRDDGTGFDTASGDGIVSATWTVPEQADSTYVFSFPDGNLTVTVQASDPPEPADEGGGGGGGGCISTGGAAWFLALLVPLLAVLSKRRRRER